MLVLRLPPFSSSCNFERIGKEAPQLPQKDYSEVFSESVLLLLPLQSLIPSFLESAKHLNVL